MIVKYFGKIAEIIGLVEEQWKNDSLTISDFKEELLAKHTVLSKETIQIAVNLKIELSDFLLANNDEIAILPPFAGG